jgi:TetR/AcrR family transcriptional regulator, mexJK operon transcriptional repressor
MDREVITRRRAQAITAAGIITRVATRIRAGKGPVKHVKGVRKSGRPSRADALKLRERILQVATELFLKEGYGSTSIESVAARAGISKRTFYDRFDDKAALFAAVVHYIIEHIRPPADVPLLAGASLPEILQRLAGLILKAALSPQALALHRLVTGESSRFPELAFAVETEGRQSEATDLIAGLLAREQSNGKIGTEDQRFAADQFIYMVVTLPQRRALGFGVPMTAVELDAWAHKVVILFLEGYKGLRMTRAAADGP